MSGQSQAEHRAEHSTAHDAAHVFAPPRAVFAAMPRGLCRFAPIEDHTHGCSSLSGDKGLPEDAGQHSGQGPMQPVCPGPAQHLHIPLGPACLMVKGL